MLSIAFGQSKYYVDSLAENTKRGLRQKVRMGIFPNQAPVGYLNDSRTKTIVVEKKKSRIVRLAFERYVKGNQRLEDIATFLAKNNGEKRVRAAVSDAPNSFGKSDKTAWAALCAAHSAVPSKPLSSILVQYS